MIQGDTVETTREKLDFGSGYLEQSPVVKKVIPKLVITGAANLVVKAVNLAVMEVVLLVDMMTGAKSLVSTRCTI